MLSHKKARLTMLLTTTLLVALIFNSKKQMEGSAECGVFFCCAAAHHNKDACDHSAPIAAHVITPLPLLRWHKLLPE